MRKIKRFLTRISILTILVLLTACSTNTNDETTQSKDTPQLTQEETQQLAQDVNSLFAQFKFNEGITLLDEEYENGISNVDLLQQYAYIEYHLFEQFEKAEEVINKAVDLDSENHSSYYLRGDIYFSNGKFEEAIDSYKEAIKYFKGKNTWDYELSMVNYSLGNCYLKSGNRISAIKSLEASRVANPYNIRSNALLHRLYVEDEEYRNAYEVWKDDNFILDDNNSLLESSKRLNKLYKVTIDNDTYDYEKLGDLYAELSLYDEAKLEYEKVLIVEGENKKVKDKLNDINIFLTFRDELKIYFDNYYRKRAVEGKIWESTIYAEIKPIYEKITVLFPEIDSPYGSPATWFKQINESIEEKFNARIEYINASGAYFGCSFGYVFDHSSTKVSHWGDEINLKHIVLKNMVSNGINSWLTKGQSGIGGWNLGNDEIVSVLKGEGCLYFMKLLDPSERKKALEEAEEFDGDLSNKESLDLFYSKTLSIRFSNENLDSLSLEAKEQGYSEEEINNYIFYRFMEYFFCTTILAHEGQHAIDGKYANSWFGEGEYTAKLSELAYGNMQFATLNQFYEPSVGSDMRNTHSRANTQVFMDFVQYIYDNAKKFPAIDTTKNILTQLTELNEEDIREIAIKIFESKYPGKKY
ncbi:tetratricopeptide repeat protein [Mycoplasmatota bacterium zrk1]